MNDEVELLTLVASLLGAATALVALLTAIRARYRQTLGRRRDRYERLARLGTGAQLSFFVAVLGEPPAIKRSITKNSVELITVDDPRYAPRRGDRELDPQETWVPRTLTECFFIDRDYYVQTISDDDETVLAFSVTVRSRRFRPTLLIPKPLGWSDRFRILREQRRWPRPLARLTLGRTRFADLDSKDPNQQVGPHFRARMGARWAGYSEFDRSGIRATIRPTCSRPDRTRPVAASCD